MQISLRDNTGIAQVTVTTSGVSIVPGVAGDQPLCRNLANIIATCSSSLRYKTDVRPFLGGLDIVKRLRPIAFTWKQGGMRSIGLAAEDVEKVEPMLTFRNDKGEIEGVEYNELSAVFINAFAEQQAQIQKQQEQISQQHELVMEQQRQIDALKRLVCVSQSNAEACMAELKGMKVTDYIYETISNAAQLPQPEAQAYDWGVTPDGRPYHWTGYIEPLSGTNRSGNVEWNLRGI